jgi:uncharacterized damage-inducible protein DinB
MDMKMQNPMEMQKEAFIMGFEREYQTTKRVLEAFPDSAMDLRPHKKLRTAREIATIFPGEEASIPSAIANLKVDMEEKFSVKNNTMKDIVAAYEKNHGESMAALKNTPADQFGREMDFFGMKMRLIDGLWFFVMDAIHHRGQFSVYLRLAEGKVPQIYGPTADYP